MNLCDASFGLVRSDSPTTKEKIGDANEICHKFSFRLFINLGGRSHLLNCPYTHYGYPVGHGECLLLIMRDVDKGYS